MLQKRGADGEGQVRVVKERMVWDKTEEVGINLPYGEFREWEVFRGL